MSVLKYKRVLIKLSGESLCEKGGSGIDPAAAKLTAEKIKEAMQAGSDIAVVIGGGNLLRGAALSSSSDMIPRNVADYMGMLATVINASALCEALKSVNAPSAVLSALPVKALNEEFTAAAAEKHFEAGEAVILAGGTGNPFFSTDTCAALRACQIRAGLIVKATKVDGVYTEDPIKNSEAKLIEKISFSEIIANDLKVIDHTAMTLCRENNIPLRVLNMFKDGNITKAVQGESVGTEISA
ncbi:UMP kinase [Sedimentisphaera salicampi]|uniref:Uridylate kinase n=1 Tax=Sedimentisphaera salicampi TaxID=1941349 RepID=A0A1W6LQH2_9BACT|nr:UMP kinase [Sedimentisphaera salicampi]ARN57982.1 Uridylate kinase [Sedimentisphaera salicampi]